MRWDELVTLRPDLTDAGSALLYQFGGVGLAFLGTVRNDGGPRMHPVCPVIVDDALFVFVEPGPKRDDLHRDPRFALHSFPPADNEDAFYVTGTARHVTDEAVIALVRQRMRDERPHVTQPPPEDRPPDELFELDVDRVLLTRTTGHGDWSPQHTVWHA
jgi:hypothetical protein